MKKKLFAVVLTAVMTIASAVSAFAAAPEGSVAYFSFDGTVDGATPIKKGFIAAEKSEWAYVDGKVGQALNVNPNKVDDIGLDTGVTIGTGSYTVSFWAQANTSNFACPLVFIGKTDQSTEAWNGIWQGLSDGWNTGTSGAGSNDATGARVGIVQTFNNATQFSFDWTYITLTVDVDNNHTATLYCDGKYVFSIEGYAALTEDAKMYVGANYWDNPCDFYIDELVVFDKALSADEVTALAASAGVGGSEEKEEPTEAPTESTDDNKTTAAPDKTDSEEGSSSFVPFGIIPIIIVVVVVVAVAAIVVVVTDKKKKKN